MSIPSDNGVIEIEFSNGDKILGSFAKPYKHDDYIRITGMSLMYLDSMQNLSKYDIKSIVFYSYDEKETRFTITYPTAGLLKDVFKSLIAAAQSDKTYGLQAKEFFAPYLKEFPLSESSKTTTTTSSNSSSKSTTSKSTVNNTTASKSTPSKSTTSKSTATTQSKNLEDETLRSLLQMPLGFMSSDIYFSYPKASAKLKQMYGANCKAEYDKCGKNYVFDTHWLKVGGYATSDFSLWIYNDYCKWSYIFPHQKTLSGAQNFCNSLASKIKALGIELINKPVESFPVYYKGNYEGMKITLTASKSIDEYYISLKISHCKEVSKSDLNPVVTVAELFERPLGAPKGKNPVHWFVEKRICWRGGF